MYILMYNKTNMTQISQLFQLLNINSQLLAENFRKSKEISADSVCVSARFLMSERIKQIFNLPP